MEWSADDPIVDDLDGDERNPKVAKEVPEAVLPLSELAERNQF